APRGHVVGTAAFMSPEQASGDLVDARSDIYSLGVVAFYALSGRLPFQAGTDEGFLAQHISDTAPKITTVVPLVPPRLAQIVDRCLSKEPWARYADAAALVRAIAEAVAPPAVPLAIRAFMVRSTHLEAPALISAFVTGVGLLPATAAAWLSPATASVLGVIDVPLLLAPLLPSIFTTGAAIALLAAVVARARTEQRTDPLGERSLRFWRGPLGRALFRIAGRRPPAGPSIVTVLGRLETPA